MLNINKIFSVVIIVQLFSCSVWAAAKNSTNAPTAQTEFNLQEIALPSEIKEMGKQQGSIFYDISVKNKVLIPVNIWGEVKQSGLHFVPSDTTFVKGMSLAGGPTSSGKLEDIVLSRNLPNGSFKEYTFDLSKGGDEATKQFKIESGDIIFVKKETFYENRAYYTTLVSIMITILSTFVIVQKIK